VVNIRDGRISSESYSSPTFQREGDRVEEEFLVVDRAGRIQLPQELSEQFRLGGLAKAALEDGTVTITPVGERPRPNSANYRKENPAP
jgi:hypothetical protein